MRSSSRGRRSSIHLWFGLIPPSPPPSCLAPVLFLPMREYSSIRVRALGSCCAPESQYHLARTPSSCRLFSPFLLSEHHAHTLCFALGSKRGFSTDHTGTPRLVCPRHSSSTRVHTYASRFRRHLCTQAPDSSRSFPFSWPQRLTFTWLNQPLHPLVV